MSCSQHIATLIITVPLPPLRAITQENVLFGLPFDPARYAACLQACALEEDVSRMPAGDATEIGERGISLSGGQKARLALARAAYSQADIHLLDDPLSAVDPRVGRVLFEKCIGPGGLLGGATRVLVTHQKQYLPLCDDVVVLRRGKVVERGTAAELAARGVEEVLVSGDQGEQSCVLFLLCISFSFLFWELYISCRNLWLPGRSCVP
jgi:ABC-type bacteriocin/lantibiotic exporter with double-glycine peptidase domain